MELDEQKYLYLLFLLPVVAVLFLFNLYWKRKKQREFGDLEVIKRLSPERSIFKPFFEIGRFAFGTNCLDFWIGKP